jgi:hypothetical protein
MACPSHWWGCADHYTGLNEKWDHGEIWCTEATARLTCHFTGVAPALMRHLAFDTPTVVHGAPPRMPKALAPDTPYCRRTGCVRSRCRQHVHVYSREQHDVRNLAAQPRRSFRVCGPSRHACHCKLQLRGTCATSTAIGTAGTAAAPESQVQ